MLLEAQVPQWKDQLQFQRLFYIFHLLQFAIYRTS